ncbi:MAG: hypothetical protein F6K22_13605 [Okeania sp. SIO2F4]|uniref:hypothetical protein n=1 Tax=Okeania sp. SIO2F4 TaxID=2607790 RepID=UPI001429EBCC|nr:hypothetical protein [Okeania sp. SIO2F4]NES03784.1 hypothetical protein [Okeania sp. SIO2F4]
MNKSLFFLNKLITTMALSMILVSWLGFNHITQAKTEEKRAACVLVDFDGRIRASGRCQVKLTTTNSGVEFDIDWDGSTRTQFSMNKFPTDGTYSVEISNGGRASMKVEKQGSVFILRSNNGFRGRVIFP